VSEALLLAVGDVAPDRPDPTECFTQAADTLRQGDVVFCQLECNLTEGGSRLPQARHTHRSTAAAANAMRGAGFTVVSFAGNHCMDWGKEGFFDTIDNLEGAGLNVVGVGANIAQAREPVVVEANGVTTAFLAYSSILPMSYWAEADRPGCAPMRAFTVYEQIEHDQPGTPARVHTYSNRADLEAMQADIAKAKSLADVVVVSHHWGIHFVPAVLADYQREVAYAAIDAGADLILGHHAHILKGIEVYKGKVIFYSLSNFAVDLRMTPEHAASKGFKEIQVLAPNWEPDFDSLYNFPPDARKTLVVEATLTKNGVRNVGYRPAYINRQAQPFVLKAGDEHFDEVADYIDWCSKAQDLSVAFRRDGDVVRIEAPAS
jgi:poly-gamma-glutamate capsule biosynthesis protein CapA/YwtB (metallophosphatase superfamily)